VSEGGAVRLLTLLAGALGLTMLGGCATGPKVAPITLAPTPPPVYVCTFQQAGPRQLLICRPYDADGNPLVGH
jgi:hypothetical protein